MSDATRTRVVYADDDAAYRTHLVQALLADPTIELLAVTVDRESASRAVDHHRPDVVVLSDSLPGDGAIEPGPDGHIMLVSSRPQDTDRDGRLRGVLDRALDARRASRLVSALGARTAA